MEKENKRIIGKYKGEEECKKRNFTKFYETSSKTNENVEDMFKDFVKEIYKKNKNKVIENRQENNKLYEVMKKEVIKNDNNSFCC